MATDGNIQCAGDSGDGARERERWKHEQQLKRGGVNANLKRISQDKKGLFLFLPDWCTVDLCSIDLHEFQIYEAATRKFSHDRPIHNRNLSNALLTRLNL